MSDDLHNQSTRSDQIQSSLKPGNKLDMRRSFAAAPSENRTHSELVDLADAALHENDRNRTISLSDENDE